jgi:hypothetical protein
MIAASPTINVIKAPSAVKTTNDYAVVACFWRLAQNTHSAIIIGVP